MSFFFPRALSRASLFARSALALAISAAGAAAAHDYTVGDLTVDHPTARVNIADRPSAGYMTIHNKGAADRLIAAQSPAFGRIELHTHKMVDGVMSMREIEAIELPANGETSLEPGGLHLMFFNPTDAFPESLLIPVTLTFEQAGEVDVTLMGERIGRKNKQSHGHAGHGHADHGHSDHGHSESGHGEGGGHDHSN